MRASFCSNATRDLAVCHSLGAAGRAAPEYELCAFSILASRHHGFGEKMGHPVWLGALLVLRHALES
jgi:hypothetical protein